MRKHVNDTNKNSDNAMQTIMIRSTLVHSNNSAHRMNISTNTNTNDRKQTATKKNNEQKTNSITQNNNNW